MDPIAFNRETFFPEARTQKVGPVFPELFDALLGQRERVSQASPNHVSPLAAFGESDRPSDFAELASFDDRSDPNLRDSIRREDLEFRTRDSEDHDRPAYPTYERDAEETTHSNLRDRAAPSDHDDPDRAAPPHRDEPREHEASAGSDREANVDASAAAETTQVETAPSTAASPDSHRENSGNSDTAAILAPAPPLSAPELSSPDGIETVAPSDAATTALTHSNHAGPSLQSSAVTGAPVAKTGQQTNLSEALKAPGGLNEAAPTSNAENVKGPKVKVTVRQASLAGVAQAPLSAATTLAAMQAGEGASAATSSTTANHTAIQASPAAVSMAAKAGAQVQQKSQHKASQHKAKDAGQGGSGKQGQAQLMTAGAQNSARAGVQQQTATAEETRAQAQQSANTGASSQNGSFTAQLANTAARATAPFQNTAPVTTTGADQGRPQLLPDSPTDQVSLHIQKAAGGGQDKINIKLNPAELGRVEVRMETTESGTLRAVVMAERPEALELLQRDARGLERSLQDAGLKTDSQSLAFERHDSHSQGRRQADDQNAGATETAALHESSVDDDGPAGPEAAPTNPSHSADGRLDISV